MEMQAFYREAIRHCNRTGKTLTDLTNDWKTETERKYTREEIRTHIENCIDSEKKNCARFYELNPTANNERKNTSTMITSALTHALCTLE